MTYDESSFNNEELSICLQGSLVLVLKDWHMNIEVDRSYEEVVARNRAGNTLMTMTIPASDTPPKIKLEITGVQSIL